MSSFLYFLLSLISCECSAHAGSLSDLVKSTRMTFSYPPRPVDKVVLEVIDRLTEVPYPEEWKSLVVHYVAATHQIMHSARKSARVILAQPLCVQRIKVEISRVVDLVEGVTRELVRVVDPSILSAVRDGIHIAGDSLKLKVVKAVKKSYPVQEIASRVASELQAFFDSRVTGLQMIKDAIRTQAKAFLSTSAEDTAIALLAFNSLISKDMIKADAVMALRDSEFHNAIARRLQSPRASLDSVFIKFRKSEVAKYVYSSEMTVSVLMIELTNQIFFSAFQLPDRDYTRNRDLRELSKRHSAAETAKDAFGRDHGKYCASLSQAIKVANWCQNNPRADQVERLESEAKGHFNTRCVWRDATVVADYLFDELVTVIARYLCA